MPHDQPRVKRNTTMRLFVYEYLTARGIGTDPDDPQHAIYLEGRAMRDAVVEDFERLPGCEVVTLVGGSPDDERARFREAVRSSEWTLLIAPEFDRILEQLCQWVYLDGGLLLGPPAAVVSVVADKLLVAQRWRQCGVPTAVTTDREPTSEGPFPLVWKPRHGAGSTATFRLDSPADLPRARETFASEGYGGPMILQQFVPGQPASVLFLCGREGYFPLLPCTQLLSADGRFKYQGGEVPIHTGWVDRATSLAARAAGCFPGLVGFVGVDVVLGQAADGSGDSAIEINPRLTTSYVGLRAIAEVNLAEVMVRVATGDYLPGLRWKQDRVRFSPAAGITRHS
jgi:predicted ATP-grasp superfamily ATP-dependent carboligase